jgi:hypothetical protein
LTSKTFKVPQPFRALFHKSLSIGLMIFFVSSTTYALDLDVSQDCQLLFSYLGNGVHPLSSSEIQNILQIPENFNPNQDPRPEPVYEVRRAVAYVEENVSPGDREDSIGLAEHRAFILKTLLARIAEVYPVWTAKLWRLDNGDFYFIGGKGHFILISAKDGSLRRGEVFR